MKCQIPMSAIMFVLMISTSSCDNNNPTLNKFIVSFGGDSWESGYSLSLTQDGGSIVAGSTQSGNPHTNGGDFEGLNHGYIDVFALKLGPSGEKQWIKTFGGGQQDGAHYIQQTQDGGYILLGSTFSNDGDFAGLNPGAVYRQSKPFLMKLNSAGEKVWVKTYDDGLGGIIETKDGGYIATGAGYDTGAANFEVLVLKLNQTGEIQWRKTIDGASNAGGSEIIESEDGGYILTGGFISNTGDFQDLYMGNGDIFVMKLNSSGDKQWLKAFGGSYSDESTSIIQDTDEGILITGGSRSVDYDFAGLDHGDTDIFVIKLNSSGEKQWVKTFGGSAYDQATEIVQTQDNGYFLTGGSTSNVGDFNGLNRGGEDIFVMKLNHDGELLWTKVFGGSEDEGGNSIKESKDGGYLLTGGTNSTDFVGLNSSNKGFGDIIVVKDF